MKDSTQRQRDEFTPNEILVFSGLTWYRNSCGNTPLTGCTLWRNEVFSHGDKHSYHHVRMREVKDVSGNAP